jgi:NAD(P)-dependent dehydrogenase (short-subunit alcohol dehydrogenase family)
MSCHPLLTTDLMKVTLHRLLTTVAATAIAAGVTAAEPAAKPAHPGMSDSKAAPVALITGSDRGIGFALVQELTGRGWRVIATCRDPAGAEALKTFAASNPRVVVEALDVSDDAAIDALSARYHEQPIDALINNAGVGGGLGSSALGNLSAEEFARVLRVNTYAPLKISVAFLEQVAASRQKKIIAITSGLGSLFQAPQFKDTSYYSISKAGLNMAMRILQSVTQDRAVLVGLVTPGPVDTDMQRAYRAAAAQSGKPLGAPTITAAESARALADYIETLGPAKAGRFYSYTGAELPW